MFEVSAGIIPVLLLVLAAQDKLAFVKPEWRRSGWLHAISTLLGTLIVGEMLSLAAIWKHSDSTAIAAYLLVVTGASLALIAWGIGWSIWTSYPADVPPDGTLEKKAFYTIGLIMLAGLATTITWAFT